MSDEDKLIQNLCDKVKQSQIPLNAKTLGELRAARRVAVDSLNSKPRHWWQLPISRYSFVTSFVFVLVIAIVYPMFTDNSPDYDIDVVAITEDLELLQDLDFYLWIADSVENES